MVNIYRIYEKNHGFVRILWYNFAMISGEEGMENSEQGQSYVRQYEDNLNKYENFCIYLESQLREVIKEMDVSYYELSYRIKTLDSILEKAERNSLSMSEIYDVIGFRIVTLFKRDASAICDVIRKVFRVVWESDKAEGKPADTFGYLSVHFQIKLPGEWLHAPTTRGFAGVEAELQVRTFSQHIWAASSHLLQYKMESVIPYVMRRNINRLSAVLEIVDDELESILKAKEAYQSYLLETSCREDEQSEILLDSILLEHILDEVFEGENKRPQEPFDDLLNELFFCDIRTVGQLKELLSSELESIQKKEDRKKKNSGKAFYSYAGRLRIAMQAHFPGIYEKMRMEYYK